MKTSLTRRQFVHWLVVGTAGAALAACGRTQQTEVPKAVSTPAATGATVAPEPTTAPATAAPKQPASIVLSGWGNVEELNLYKNIIAAFMQDNPDVKVDLLGIPDAGEYGQKLFPMIAAGTAPDCIRTGTQFFPGLYAQGALLDLTPYFEKSPEMLDPNLYFTDLYDIYRMDGKYYGTILGPTVMLMYYNADLFAKAGVQPPTDSWTLADYVEAAKQLTVRDGDRIIQYGSNVVTAREVWEGIVWSKGGQIFDDMRKPTKCLLDSPEAIDTFRWMQDLVYKHKVAPTTAQLQGLEGGWDSGRIAMELTGSWSINTRRKITAFKWDLAHQPKDKYRVACHFAGAVVVYAKTKFKDASWALARYFQSDRAQKLIAEDGLNTPMMRKWAESDTFLKLPGAPPHHRVRVEVMQYSRNRDAYFPAWQEVQSKVWAPEIDKLMLNKQSPEETAQNITKGTNALLRK